MDSSWLQYADPHDPARDLTVEAATVIGIGKALKSASSSKSIPYAKLKALLDSRNDREILEGLRRVISMIYQNYPCLPYFSSVVKNVANPSIEVKKLVYIYLLHYAESDPDLALLSINAIQKSLTDQNPQVRALALRTMSGMRVPVISQIVSLAIKRGVSDMSPLVRKAAALAIPKCYALDANTLPQLLDYLSTLLGDKQYFVVGPAVQTFLEICPHRIDLIHKHYRSLCRKLVDMDEWSQLATLKLLTDYSRQCFPLRYEHTTLTTKQGFYDDEPDETTTSSEQTRILDPDLILFLNSCSPLLLSRNPAVITAITSVYHQIGTPTHLANAIGPLISLLRSSTSTASIALTTIVTLALTPTIAQLFVPHASHFLPLSADTDTTAALKIEMLALLFPHAQLHLQSLILSELAYFSHSATPTLIRESVRAIGRCSQSSPSPATSSRCFKVLLNLISSFDAVLVAEVLTVMRHLIQRDPLAHRKTVVRLARNLDGIGMNVGSAAARATVVWLVGEFAGMDVDGPAVGGGGGRRVEEGIAPDVLRILVKGFAEESEEVKGQVVLLAAKVYLLWLLGRPEVEKTGEERAQRDDEGGFEEDGDTNGNGAAAEAEDAEFSSHSIPLLYNHVLLLCRYDTSYDLRDRARLFRNLLANPQSTQLARLLLLAPKPVPKAPSPSEIRKGFAVGSTTGVLGRDIVGEQGLRGYEAWKLLEWVEEGREPDASLRDGDGDGDMVGVGEKGKVAASQLLEERVKEQGLEGVVRAKMGIGKGERKERSLDDWLEESEEEEEEKTEEETEEELVTASEEDEETEEEVSEGEDADQRKGLMS